MITDQLTTALCNTLMHSVWQGILLAAAAGGIIIATRRSSSALRYNLLISAMMLFAVGVLVTFAGQFQKTESVVVQPIQVHGINIIGTANRRPQQAQQPGVTDRIESYLNDHRNTIILVWFLIICVRSLQLGVGLYGTYRIRRIRVSTVQDHWRDRMQQLAKKLGMGQTITLLESGLAKAPMVVGHLKPVILVPIGMLTALSTEALEAILIHELAHIKRRDYLVNLLQSGMEIVFFFNPAVLWISKLIRIERENCCDDLAVAQNHSKANYIRALVSCEEYKAAVPPYAMGFPGGAPTLLDRVKRMANDRNHSLNLFEKTVLAVCLVGVGLFMTAFSATPSASTQKPTPIEKTKQDIVTTKRDSSYIKSAAAYNRSAADYKTATPYPPNYRPPTTYQQDRNRYWDREAKYIQDAANIKIDLIKEGLVSDTNHLHFTLNDTTFILNGIPQSQAIRKRYWDKYVPADNGPGWGWTHGTERGNRR